MLTGPCTVPRSPPFRSCTLFIMRSNREVRARRRPGRRWRGRGRKEVDEEATFLTSCSGRPTPVFQATGFWYHAWVDNPGRATESSGTGGDAGTITRLLRHAAAGDDASQSRLIELVYDQLRAIAKARLVHERGAGAAHTLQPTALVHEAYLRLLSADDPPEAVSAGAPPGSAEQPRRRKRADPPAQPRPGAVATPSPARPPEPRRLSPFECRAHFFAAAATAMERILIEHARARMRHKRGGVGGAPAGAGPRRRIPLSDVLDLAASDDPERIVSLHEAIQRMESQDAELASIVRLRFFAGLSLEETGATVGLSRATVNRRWNFARAWLYRALAGPDEPPPRPDP